MVSMGICRVLPHVNTCQVGNPNLPAANGREGRKKGRREAISQKGAFWRCLLQPSEAAFWRLLQKAEKPSGAFCRRHHRRHQKARPSGAFWCLLRCLLLPSATPSHVLTHSLPSSHVKPDKQQIQGNPIIAAQEGGHGQGRPNQRSAARKGR